MPLKRHPPTSICRVGVCVCVTSLLYISSECFPRHSSQMHESSKPPKSMEYIYVYIIEVDTRNTDLLYNTVCISFFATVSNLKTLNLSIYVYACIYIYINMYVCVEVTRPTLYIDDIYIYIYVCMYLYAAYMFLVFFMQILGFLNIGTQTC